MKLEAESEINVKFENDIEVVSLNIIDIKEPWINGRIYELKKRINCEYIWYETKEKKSIIEGVSWLRGWL